MMINVITLCSGYDRQCMALNRIKEEYGLEYNLVAWSEIDRYACEAHDAAPMKRKYYSINAKPTVLLGCDAIYMMDNWVDSIGASIEYDVAMRTGKDVWFESNVVRNNLVVMKIQNAIHEAMGLKFNDYITKSRKRDGFFARMIFVYHCRQNKMRLIKIAEYVKRDHSTMLHLLKKYQDDFNYNPQFREIATKVNNILNKTSE